MLLLHEYLSRNTRALGLSKWKGRESSRGRGRLGFGDVVAQAAALSGE